MDGGQSPGPPLPGNGETGPGDPGPGASEPGALGPGALGPGALGHSARHGAAGTAWFDDAAGPVVRPYALTGGRTHYDGVEFDLVSLVTTVVPAEPADDPPPASAPPWAREPEHELILELCRTPLSVAEIASDLELPLGVVRVLLGDLLDHSLIQVRPPAPVAQFPSERVLKEVIDGIRAL
nr:DUF742 domain-containing protein [Actinomadura sp. NEAU-AAG7]